MTFLGKPLRCFFKALVSIFIGTLCLMCKNWCTQVEPWLPEYLQFEWRTTFLTQYFPKKSHDYQHAYFLTTGLMSSLLPDTSLEIEGILASSSRQGKRLDHLKFTGRYLFLDEWLEDALSGVLGVSIMPVFGKSLKDPYSFHHGKLETELFCSLGKVFEDRKRGSFSQFWAMAALGLADKGTAWQRIYLQASLFIGELQELSFFSHFLRGNGHKTFHYSHFKGYGSVAHHSLDIGFRYAYEISFWGKLILEYAYRIYASQYPHKAQSLFLQIYYPFSF